MKQSFNPLMALALATAPLVAGCQTVPKTLDTNTCSYTYGARSGSGITGVFQSIVPGYRSLKPSQPCIYANNFMALVDIAQTGENIKNHHMTGAVVSTYEELQQTRGKFAAETLKLIDERLTGQSLSIDHFRALRDQYRPREISREAEGKCTMITVEEFGRREDRRICGVRSEPLPQ